MHLKSLLRLFGIEFTFNIKSKSQEIDEMRQMVEAFDLEVKGLTSAIALMNAREQMTRQNSTVLLGSVLAQYGGEIKLEGNIIDLVTNNSNLSVHIDEVQDDGSRVLRLLEDASSVDEQEPTDEELASLEKEFLDELEPGDYREMDEGDDDDDECSGNCASTK